MVATEENLIKIDEAHFCGRTKYGKGRRLRGYSTKHEDESAPQDPRFFGIYKNKEKVRFCGSRSKSNTLIPIIEDNVQEVSVLSQMSRLRIIDYMIIDECMRQCFTNVIMLTRIRDFTLKLSNELGQT